MILADLIFNNELWSFEELMETCLAKTMWYEACVVLIERDWRSQVANNHWWLFFVLWPLKIKTNLISAWIWPETKALVDIVKQNKTKQLGIVETFDSFVSGSFSFLLSTHVPYFLQGCQKLRKLLSCETRGSNPKTPFSFPGTKYRVS